MENKYMRAAINAALESEKEGEVPVGAVIVKDGTIIATGRNRRETNRSALCHAELEAIQKACEALSSWRLQDCDLYVTLEPCPMCAGAIINARIKTVYFGAFDDKAGSFGSLADLSRVPYNHKPEILGGIMERECTDLMKNFFEKIRKEKAE